VTCEGGGGKERKSANRLTDIIDTGFIRHVFSYANPDLDLDEISLDTS